MLELNKIHKIDSLEGLKQLPGNYVDCVMNSPPYWALRDYGTASWVGGSEGCNHLNGTLQSTKTTLHPGTSQNDKRNFTGMPFKDICKKCGAKRIDLQLGLEPTFDEYITKLCNIFDEVKRVLKPSGTCWVNLGDTYGGSGKGDVGYSNKSTLRNGNISDNEKYRKVAKESWNFDKKPQTQGDVSKSLTLIPFRFAIEMVNRGWILRNTIIWHKPNCMPSSAKDRFTVDFEYVFFFVKSKKYFFESQYEPQLESSKERYQYDFPGNPGYIYPNEKRDRPNNFNGKMMIEGGRNKRTVWSICPQPFPEAHFAVYPEELCETPLKSGCPEFVCKKCGKAREKIITTEYVGSSENRGGHIVGNGQSQGGLYNIPKESAKKVDDGYTNCGCWYVQKFGNIEHHTQQFEGGIVLDPFMGAGTTALVALKQNKRFIGFEINKDYIDIANKRLKPYLEQTKLTDSF